MQPGKEAQREMIGLVPAAGQATRIAPLPCSKELYPIEFLPMGEGPGMRPKVVCHYLLEKMKLAGVERAFIVLRSGKWDVPAYFGDGTLVDMHLAYLMMGVPFGPPYTLDQAYPFVQKAIVVFGFPDILFQPGDTFVKLIARQATTNADIVLGLFPAHDPKHMDMVDIDDTGRVRVVLLKPHETDLRYAWICAVWTPIFTRFMHDYLAEQARRELSVGAVLQAAIEQKLRVEGVSFQTGTYLDIGTPEGLVKAQQYQHRGPQ